MTNNSIRKTTRIQFRAVFATNAYHHIIYRKLINQPNDGEMEIALNASVFTHAPPHFTIICIVKNTLVKLI